MSQHKKERAERGMLTRMICVHFHPSDPLDVENLLIFIGASRSSSFSLGIEKLSGVSLSDRFMLHPKRALYYCGRE